MANKLKTLYDIDSESCWGEFKRDEEYFKESDLKKEAIKWYNRSDDDKHAFIKKFFNITDKEIIDAKVSGDEQ